MHPVEPGVLQGVFFVPPEKTIPPILSLAIPEKLCYHIVTVTGTES